MSNYCNIKGMICHNCNEYGNCQVTGCSYPDAITAIKMDSPMDEEDFLDKVKQEQGNVGYIKVNNFDEMEKYRMAKSCQICGEPTESLDDYICPECKRRLKAMLYGDYSRQTSDEEIIELMKRQVRNKERQTFKVSRRVGNKEIVYTLPVIFIEEKNYSEPTYEERCNNGGIAW